MEQTILQNTACGAIRGLDRDSCNVYLGVRYATAGRFEYPKEAGVWDGEYDATHYGDACPQKRIWYEHLEIPERLFYHNEFRKNHEYSYSEDCLNLNIFTPKGAGSCPVIVFIHGGGFDSGANHDTAIDGTAYAKRGIVFVSINYRVAIFGYLTHEDVKNGCGHEGNFGLYDQYTALCWIKKHIADFGGNPENITVMGQSAGAISIQYLCLSEKCRRLFQRAVMLSGGGQFPKFALPRPAERTREYWLDLMAAAGASGFSSLKSMNPQFIFDAWEELKKRRKDNTYNTMPVIDGDLITAPVDELIKHPLPVDYMLGYTNNDMYAILMSHISHKYARANRAYLYYFDIDAPGGDKNGAFHSSDLRYVFGTLQNSHRPYTASDYAVSELMVSYLANFAATGNPNGSGLPRWEAGSRQALHITGKLSKIKMARPNTWKLLWNTLTKGDPK